MTSDRAIAANRANAQKSRGPRTDAGKQRSSRNAARHGLSAVHRDNPKHLEQIEQMAKAICSGDPNPQLHEQAIIIAENELLLRYISAERAVLIEKWRDPLATSAKSRSALAMAKHISRQTDIAYYEFSQLKAKLLKQGEEIFTFIEARKCEPDEPPWRYEAPQVRDEFEAMQKAMPELERLKRYERRAWSRRKRAISMFSAIKVGISASL